MHTKKIFLAHILSAFFRGEGPSRNGLGVPDKILLPWTNSLNVLQYPMWVAGGCKRVLRLVRDLLETCWRLVRDMFETC